LPFRSFLARCAQPMMRTALLFLRPRPPHVVELDLAPRL